MKKALDNLIVCRYNRQRRLRQRYAGVAELADALDSGSNGRKAVQVQVLSPAPEKDIREGVLLFLTNASLCDIFIEKERWLLC